MTPISSFADLARLPASDRWLLRALAGIAVLALLFGVAFGAATGFVRAGFIAVPPELGYRWMTLHGVTIFFYWLYFAQAALLLALAAIGAHHDRIALAPLAWAGFLAMAAGLVLSETGGGTGSPLLYDGAPELVGDERTAAGLFYTGYLLLGLGLFLTGAAAIATALVPAIAGPGAAVTSDSGYKPIESVPLSRLVSRAPRLTNSRKAVLAPRFAGAQGTWSSLAFGAVGWAGLLMVSGIAAVNAFLPAALWAFGFGEAPANHSTGWHILFHNLHYLPLMGTVLLWYALAREFSGAGSLFGTRFSKLVFASYLLLVPPTSLYHMFLEPGLAPLVRVLGSVLSLFISLPTVAAFLIIVTSLEAAARARGARGLFGWLRALPWRDPAVPAFVMAVVNLAFGGIFAFVLIQEKLAPLLSDTFFVPGYFHFLTVGTVSLTLIAALLRLLPALNGRAPSNPVLLRWLPYVLTAGLLLFGGAGIAAGLSGMPRRILDAGYDGAAPGGWLTASSVIGLGAAVMAAALLAYAVVLLAALVGAGRAEPHARAEPATDIADRAIGQAAWTGTLSVAVLIVAMYAATIAAFWVLRSLPLAALGGGGH